VTLTMYGLSLTASLLCASATLLFASATFLARSSFTEGELGAGLALAVSLGTTTLGTGVAGEGAPTMVADEDILSEFVFCMAATLAAISARFCAIIASGDWWIPRQMCI
jgi:hypothetical protein